MKSKKIFLAVLFTFVIVTSYSQIPGYLGKKTTVDYSIATFPALGLKFMTGENINMALLHNFTVSHTIDRNLSIGLNYSFSIPKLVLASNNYDEDGSSGRRVEKTTFKARWYGAEFQIYRRNYVAPVGSFFNLGYSFGSFELSEPIEVLFDANFGKDTVQYDVVNYKCSKLTFGINNKKIIGGNVYLISGLSLNYVFGGDIYSGSELKYEVYDSNRENQALFLMSRRQKLDNLFTFRLGIGLIVF